jgi:hypothetical protein
LCTGKNRKRNKQAAEKIEEDETIQISEYEANNLRMRQQRAQEWLEIRQNARQNVKQSNKGLMQWHDKPCKDRMDDGGNKGIIHFETTKNYGNEGTTSLMISETSNENADDSDKENHGNKGIIYLTTTKNYGNEGTTNLIISGTSNENADVTQTEDSNMQYISERIVAHKKTKERGVGGYLLRTR